MSIKNKSFIKYPTKKAVISFTALWFIGFTLLLLASTDLFTENPFKAKYLVVNFIMLVSTLFMLLLHINFQKNKSIKNDLKLKS
jgi:hypothetical protein